MTDLFALSQQAILATLRAVPHKNLAIELHIQEIEKMTAAEFAAHCAFMIATREARASAIKAMAAEAARKARKPSPWS